MEEEKKVFEAPKADVVKMEAVHNAKSWNNGKGKDKTGTGNSGKNHEGGNPGKRH